VPCLPEWRLYPSQRLGLRVRKEEERDWSNGSCLIVNTLIQRVYSLTALTNRKPRSYNQGRPMQNKTESYAKERKLRSPSSQPLLAVIARGCSSRARCMRSARSASRRMSRARRLRVYVRPTMTPYKQETGLSYWSAKEKIEICTVQKEQSRRIPC